MQRGEKQQCMLEEAVVGILFQRQLVDSVYGLIASVMLGQTQGMKEGVPS